MRPVTVTITNITVGSAHILSYPHRPRPHVTYRVPLYRVTIEGRNAGNNRVTEDFEAIRFGVYRTRATAAKVVGLADAQTHTLSWDEISTMEEYAWRVYAGFFIHGESDNPSIADMGSIGCVEICGAGEWTRFNNTIKKLTGLTSLGQVSNKRLVTAEYQSAGRPPLLIVQR